MDLTKDIMDFSLKVQSANITMTDTANVTTEMPIEDQDFIAANCQRELLSKIDATLRDSRENMNQIDTKYHKSSTPELLENAAKVTTATKVSTDGHLTPPPRPMTSSEVVGFTMFEDNDINLDPTIDIKPCHSLPASPNHLKRLQMPSLYDFTATKHFTTLPSTATAAAAAAAAVAATATDSKMYKLSANEPDIMRQRNFNHATSNASINYNTNSNCNNNNNNTNNNQQFCLRWNNYQNNLTNVFDELLQNESFVDVTLACDGQSIKAHKMVLSACSPYFQALFYDNPCQHPIIIMRDVRWQELKALMEFMYKGEINVSQDQINPLLKVAETLKIRGLAEVSANRSGISTTTQPLIMEQRMTACENVDEKNTIEIAAASAAAAIAAETRAAEIAALPTSCRKSSTGKERDVNANVKAPKRPRIGVGDNSANSFTKHETHAHKVQRIRKRSRDSHLLENNEHFSNGLLNSTYDNSHMTSPAHNIIHSNEAMPSDISCTTSTTIATAQTTSTIVRNPFASPPNHSLNQISTSTTNSNEIEKISSPPSSSSLPTSYRNLVRNCSPSQNNNNVAMSIRSAMISPPIDTRQHLPLHARPPPTDVDVAAAFANPNHPHHRAAQQLAAHHQLHAAAAAQSHAAMATALAVAASSNNTLQNMSNPSNNPSNTPLPLHDDMEIKPEIAEMIREEERAKLIEGGHPWPGSTNSSVTESYQYQLQSMWQKCWSTNQQNLIQQLRFRERGPLKSWRPEAMAEAIFSVLKEGLSLSQAARKYDIPYPTFVLYANRVHNMLGPSLDGGSDPRPKARGRPQRILLGMWPDELIRSVIKAVVFRDYREYKDDVSALPFVNGQPHLPPPFHSPNAIMTNGLTNAAKLAQNAVLEPGSPLNTMTENFRRHLISQQQQQQQQQHQHHSPVPPNVNIYKSPAYLHRSEMDDIANLELIALTKHKNDRRVSDNLADLNKLGLMGMPGMGVMPTSSGRPNQIPTNLFPPECELDHERQRNNHRSLKEREAQQFGTHSKNVMPERGDVRIQTPLSTNSRSASPYTNYVKSKESHHTGYNKRFLESLPPGIDFEAIANGLLHKNVSKSPRFEDLFSGHEMNELLINPETNPTNSAAAGTTSSSCSPQRNNLMKIKMEQQQQMGEISHED